MEAESSWTSSQRRRISKPLIEKRRRARINRSLSQLVEIIAKPDRVQENRTARLEKAYILEMTVEYLKKIRDLQILPENSSYGTYENSFQEGYRLCMEEVQNFFNKNLDKKVSEEFLKKSIQRYLCRRLKPPTPDNSTLGETHTDRRESSHLVLNQPSIEEVPTQDSCAPLLVNKETVIKRHYKSEYSTLDSTSSTSSASTEDESTMCISESESSSGEVQQFYEHQRFVGNAEIYNNDIQNDGPVWRPW